MIQILKPDFEFEDERGKLVQLVHQGFKQINVITSNAGVVRGNHYHKLNKEAFFVIDGSFKLLTEKEGKKEEFYFKKGDMFLINEYVVHSFEYIENTVLVSMYNLGVELQDGVKDIYRV